MRMTPNAVASMRGTSMQPSTTGRSLKIPRNLTKLGRTTGHCGLASAIWVNRRLPRLESQLARRKTGVRSNAAGTIFVGLHGDTQCFGNRPGSPPRHKGDLDRSLDQQLLALLRTGTSEREAKYLGQTLDKIGGEATFAIPSATSSTIRAIEVHSDSVPYADGCELVAPDYAALVGTNLLHGYKKELRERYGDM